MTASSVIILVLMGVSASGKTTVGKKLSEKHHWSFEDGDSHHPKTNIKKMSRGQPLDDNDRRPWLERLNRLIAERLKRGQKTIIACSALKEKYRRYLLIDRRVQLVYLKADKDLIKNRIKNRAGHFMKEKMVESQFADLEEPKDGLFIDVREPLETNINKIESSLENNRFSRS